jgi:predicted PurR-regulated permease PerM
MVAIILYPVCKWLEKRFWSKSLAIAASLGILTLLISILTTLFVWQVHVFRQDLPVIKEKLTASLPQLQQWTEKYFGLTIAAQARWLESATSINSLTNLIKGAVNTTINTFFYLFMVPIFSALFLYHRQTFVYCLQLTIGAKYPLQLQKVLRLSTQTYFNFIKGMAMVYPIVGTLNSIGLMALGVKHAWLFGMLTAVMTIIPYIGIIISALLPISIAWITKDSIWYPFGVIAVFTFVQYLEANVIFPKVVGMQLNISTWATLVAVIAGGILWGAAGMILFIPFLALLKIITDNIEEWKPLNILLSR